MQWEPEYPIMSDDMLEEHEQHEPDPDDWYDQQQFDRAVDELREEGKL